GEGEGGGGAVRQGGDRTGDGPGRAGRGRGADEGGAAGLAQRDEGQVGRQGVAKGDGGGVARAVVRDAKAKDHQVAGEDGARAGRLGDAEVGLGGDGGSRRGGVVRRVRVGRRARDGGGVREAARRAGVHLDDEREGRDG